MGPDPSCSPFWPGSLQYLLISCPASMPAPLLIFYSQQNVESSCFCCCSVSLLRLTPFDPMDCSMPGLSVPHCLPKFSQVHVHCIGSAIHPSYLLTPSSPSALNLSQHQGLFQWVICYHQMTKILEFQLQHQSFQGVFGLIFLKTDWFDFLAVQGIFRSLFQLHSLKSSILRCSAFFMVQLSQPYMTTGKT